MKNDEWLEAAGSAASPSGMFPGLEQGATTHSPYRDEASVAPGRSRQWIRHVVERKGGTFPLVSLYNADVPWRRIENRAIQSRSLA